MNQIIPLDRLTFFLFIFYWPLWIVWEIVLIKLRGSTPNLDLISGVARDRGYQFNAMVFAWGSLAGHYWLTWKVLPWETKIPAVMFWVLIAVVLACDIYLWNTSYDTFPLWLRVIRWPALVLILGLLNGVFLFPQKGWQSQPF